MAPDASPPNPPTTLRSRQAPQHARKGASEGPRPVGDAISRCRLIGSPGERRRRSVSFSGSKRDAERELTRLVTAFERDDSSVDRATASSLLETWWDQKRDHLPDDCARVRSPHRPPAASRPRTTLAGPALGADLDAYYVRLEREGISPPRSTAARRPERRASPRGQVAVDPNEPSEPSSPWPTSTHWRSGCSSA